MTTYGKLISENGSQRLSFKARAKPFGMLIAHSISVNLSLYNDPPPVDGSSTMGLQRAKNYLSNSENYAYIQRLKRSCFKVLRSRSRYLAEKVLQILHRSGFEKVSALLTSLLFLLLPEINAIILASNNGMQQNGAFSIIGVYSQS